jgi:hypothetical protein
MVRNSSRILSDMKRIGLSLRSFDGPAVLVFCLMASFWLGSPWVRAVAEQRGPEQRIVQGKVVDGGNAVVNGAVVYLKDDHSLSVKSYITDADGTYRFGQLAQNTDYELWAESNGKKSSVKTISSFDSKNQFFINLKIDTNK